jgi:hypothetical protein
MGNALQGIPVYRMPAGELEARRPAALRIRARIGHSRSQLRATGSPIFEVAESITKIDFHGNTAGHRRRHIET